MNSSEVLINCPYNKAHALLPSRMQFHLTKCRLNYPNLEKGCCPFNATHVMNKVEIQLHINDCPDRGLVDNFVYRMSGSEAPSGLLPIQTFEVCSNHDESWDDVPENKTSVLTEMADLAKTKGVLIPKIGAPRAERKNHRFNERLRHAALSSESQIPSHQPSQSHAGQAPPRAPEPKKVEVAPSQTVDQPKATQSPQASSSQSASLVNPWSGGKSSAPSVRSELDFPILGSKGSRRDNDTGLQDQLNNMTLTDGESEKRNVWGKPLQRQQHAQIPVPAGGVGGGNRSHTNPWGNRSQQQQQQQPSKPVTPESRPLGAMPVITPDDFPTLMPHARVRKMK